MSICLAVKEYFWPYMGWESGESATWFGKEFWARIGLWSMVIYYGFMVFTAIYKCFLSWSFLICPQFLAILAAIIFAYFVYALFKPIFEKSQETSEDQSSIIRSTCVEGTLCAFFIGFGIYASLFESSMITAIILMGAAGVCVVLPFFLLVCYINQQGKNGLEQNNFKFISFKFLYALLTGALPNLINLAIAADKLGWSLTTSVIVLGTCGTIFTMGSFVIAGVIFASFVIIDRIDAGEDKSWVPLMVNLYLTLTVGLNIAALLGLFSVASTVTPALAIVAISSAVFGGIGLTVRWAWWACDNKKTIVDGLSNGLTELSGNLGYI